MREFVKSVSSLGLGMSFLGLQLMQDMLTPSGEGERKSPATRTLDSVVNATAEQFGSTLRATFRAVDNVQRGITGIAFDALWPYHASSRTTDDRRADDRRTEAQRDDEVESIYQRQQRDEAAVRHTHSAYPMAGTVETYPNRGRRIVVTEMPGTEASRRAASRRTSHL